MRKISAKKTIRESYAESAAAERMWAAAFGKQVRADIVQLPEVTKRGPVVNRSDGSELEAAVMREVASIIAIHPNVAFAVRQNSGSLQDANGVPVWFYKWARRRNVIMRITDYWGMTTGGKLWAIECKRRNWTKPSGQREEEQKNFILTVTSAGGIGGFVTSGEQAKLILDNK